jgi:hypothetical protein
MSGGHALGRLVFGSREGISGTVYGTIVVMGAVVAGSGSGKSVWQVAAVAATTSSVFWLAHLYADGLEHSIHSGRRLERRTLTAIAHQEAPIALAAIGPTGALVLGGIGAMGEETAVWVALGLGLVTLAIQGVRYARIEHIGPLATLAAVSVNVALGLVIVALKVAVSH